MADQNNINGLIQRRDRLKENIQRVRGRLDHARTELSSVEDECRKRKVDPSKIDAVIDQLRQKVDQETNRLALQLSEAESAITPYLEER